jgi:membrane protein YqaA with SNARE-associated domain
MRTLAHWIITLCATPAGVIVLAALDSTLFFSLPFGIDAAVILLAARLGSLWWIVPLLASAGSVAGAAVTFWMGVKIGEQGLERWVPEKRLMQIHAKVRQKAPSHWRYSI